MQNTEKILEILDCNYEVIESIVLNEKTYLGNKDLQVCRFCNNQSPKVSFKQIAHALPEFIGNKFLFSYYECDDCNKLFSVLETNMAEYMKLYHCHAGVKGKRRVPSFKPNMQQKSRIDHKNDRIEILLDESNLISCINDEQEKVLTIKSTRTYTPLLVFKCLTKMALTIMPEDKIQYFSKTINWVRGLEELPYKLPQTKYYVYDGDNPLQYITCVLIARKNKHESQVPYMMFMLAYSNFVFQIPVILSQVDSGLENIDPYWIPTHIDIRKGKMHRKCLDLSSEQIIKEPCAVEMSYKGDGQIFQD